jgi:hypothetical protein
MTEEHQPVDAALRKLVGEHQPSAQDRLLAEQRLTEAIRAESKRASGRWTTRLVWIAALAAVTFGTIYLLRPTQLEAATEEIASAAEAVDPLTLPANTYLYTRADVVSLGLVPAEALGDLAFDRPQLTYLLPATRETWVAADGTIQIKTTNQAPIFFTPESEAAYYAAELDKTDAIGETITQTFPPSETPETWPTEVEALDEAIRSRTAERDLPDTIEYLDVALDILRENPIEPGLRANTIRLIGNLPGLNIVAASDQQTRFAIDYIDRGLETSYSFTLDNAGNLTSEETTLLEFDAELGIPANTAVAFAAYKDQQVVNGLASP